MFTEESGGGWKLDPRGQAAKQDLSGSNILDGYCFTASIF